MAKCKTCEYWKNQQAELSYSRFFGICVCYNWDYSINVVGDVMVLDRQNISEAYNNVQRFETAGEHVPAGAINESRYCFVTEEAFGCIHHKKKK